MGVLRDVARDLRYGARTLRRSRGFTAAAVLTLGLGVGASTAMFSIVDGVLLRPLPYPHSARLVAIDETVKGTPASISYPDFLDWRARQPVFEAVGVHRSTGRTLTGRGMPRTLGGAEVSWEVFAALGVPAERGRVLGPADQAPGAPPVVVVSDGFWRRELGGDPGVLGALVTLDGQPHAVVGVMPPAFTFPYEGSFWVPVQPAAWTSRGSRGGLEAMARLRAGVSLAQARAALETIAAQLRQQFPDSNRYVGVRLEGLLDHRVGDARRSLWVLLAAALLVLLIACANVAGLLLARAVAREREVGIRAALGAGAGRLARQVLTESALLSAAGTALGLAIAWLGVGVVQAVAERWIPRAGEIAVDGRVLGFAVALAVLTTLLFGAAPAWHGRGVDVQRALKDGALPGQRRARLRQGLVVAEVALTSMLLVGAGLLGATVRHLLAIDPGFAPGRLVTFRMSLPDRKYPTLDEQIAFFQRWLESLRALPGVRAASFASQVPLDSFGSETSFVVEGQPEPAPPDRPRLEMIFIDRDYFRVLGIPLLRGRTFDAGDGRPPGEGPDARMNVVVLDAETARRLWPGQDPIGQRLRIPFGARPEQPVPTVVGVVGRVKLDGLREDAARAQAYFPFAQSWRKEGIAAVVDSPLPLEPLVAAVRRMTAALDPEQPIHQVETLAGLRDDHLGTERVSLWLVGLFGGVALILAVVGLYGVLAYGVAQRQREIGIRMALGARRAQVVALVLRQGLLLAGAGVAAGIVGALALGRALEALLYGVKPRDPATFVAVTATVLAVAALASYLPGRRAATADPARALRGE